MTKSFPATFWNYYDPYFLFYFNLQYFRNLQIYMCVHIYYLVKCTAVTHLKIVSSKECWIKGMTRILNNRTSYIQSFFYESIWNVSWSHQGHHEMVWFKLAVFRKKYLVAWKPVIFQWLENIFHKIEKSF